MKGLYKITNLTTGKFYIGSSTNIKNRWSDHRRCLRDNNHCNSHLQNSWNKYTESDFVFEVFNVVDKDTTLEQIRELEQKVLDSIEDWTACFNIARNVDNSFMSEETKLKISRANVGRKLSEEFKQKITKIRQKSGSGITKTSSNKFKAMIYVNRERLYLGTFNTYEEALDAKLKAEKEYW